MALWRHRPNVEPTLSWHWVTMAASSIVKRSNSIRCNVAEWRNEKKMSFHYQRKACKQTRDETRDIGFHNLHIFYLARATTDWTRWTKKITQQKSWVGVEQKAMDKVKLKWNTTETVVCRKQKIVNAIFRIRIFPPYSFFGWTSIAQSSSKAEAKSRQALTLMASAGGGTTGAVSRETNDRVAFLRSNGKTRTKKNGPSEAREWMCKQL